MKKKPVGEHIFTEVANAEWGVSQYRVNQSERDPAHSFRKRFCRTCPWLKANIGVFPARAFEVSAPTSYDIPDAFEHGSPSFQCHSDPDRMCAGYIRSINGVHSLPVRRLEAQVPGLMDQIEEAPSEAFENYRDMAVANGVEEGSPSIKKVRTDL